MKKFSRVLCLLLALVMMFTMLPATGLAVVEQETSTGSSKGITSPLDDPSYGNVISEHYPNKATDSPVSVAPAGGSVVAEQIPGLNVDLTQNNAETNDLAVSLYAPDEVVRVIVVLEGKSLLEQGFTTEQIASGTSAVQSQVNSMISAQNAVAARIANLVAKFNAELTAAVGLVGSAAAPEVKYNYTVSMNGMAVQVPYAILNDIRALNGVDTAFVAPQYSIPEDMTDDSADPSMYATGTLFGTVQTWETLGYTGAGMRIAIIDTGLDTDHPSFSADGFVTTDTSLTLSEIESVLPNLNAAARYNGLTAEDLYISTKIPYGFNYVDSNLDVTHDNDYAGDHGTHVAGIAAANKLDSTTVVGVAPDAQLIPMKVFGYNGGAYFDDILAALEDCFYLNVDAVNLSLGSAAGFSTSGAEEVDAVYARILESDMIASISAGNSYSSAYGNTLGTNVNFTSDPDNGVISSPATWTGATVVASLENSHFMINYLTAGGRDIAFADVYAYAETYAWSMLTLVGQELTYVVVPGVGTADDFAQVDVAGKVALVQRGSIDFVTKQLNAYNNGAVACLVYDNVAGTLISMAQLNNEEGYEDIVFPNAFITMDDGLYLVDLAGEDGEGTLTITEDLMAAESPLAGTMSDFSSWGVTPDLQLVPDVTAPGGNIFSCYTDGQYGTMSGTSMSAPHIAGMSALVLQYLRDNYDLSDSLTHTIAEALIMSTATPVVEPSGALYSPRKQGSGAANVYSALTSTGYLTVDGGKPKVSLGDDDAKTGVYTFSFEINNLSDEDKAYRLEGTALTDYVQAIYGYAFMGESSLTLGSAFTFTVGDRTIPGLPTDPDYNEDGTFDLNDVQDFLDDVNYERITLAEKQPFDLITDGVLDTADVQALYEILRGVEVPAGGSVTVTVTVTLSEDDKVYMDYYYPNGIYVDGFVRCYAQDGTVDLSLPFMGFYGDWSKAGNLFDTGWYYDDYAMPERYYNVLWTTFGSSGYNLGLNPYLNEAYDPAHNVVSPNGDGYQDAVDDIYLGMMRGARQLVISWKDHASGETLAKATADYVRKSYYMPAYGICYPFVYSDYFYQYYTFMDANGQPLPDGTVVDLVLEGYLDDGDEILDDSYSTSIVVDNTAPVMDTETVQYNYDAATDSRELVIEVSDNYDIAAVITLTNAGSPIEYIAVDDQAGEKTTLTIDVSGYDSTFYVVVCDYGCNESYYEISFSGEFNVDFDKFYAYRRYAAIPVDGYIYITDAYNGWYSFEDPDSMVMHTSMYNDSETAVAAAEYIDGYIFGVDVTGNIFVMKSGDWTRIPLGTMPEARNSNWDYVPYPALDMAYDYANDVLYILTDELDYGAGGHLMSLDYMTGEVTDLGIVTTSEGSQPLTLACDNDGVLYAIELYTGDLYTIDPADAVTTEPENWWDEAVTTIAAELVGSTGFQPAYVQTMTVDHDTNTLYWMAFDTVYGSSVMYAVDKATGELTEVGDVEYTSEMVALYKPYNSGKDIIPDAALEAIELSATNLVMKSNTHTVVSTYPVPFNAELGELTWTSSNEEVAMVIDGTVIALTEGNAIITVTNGDGISASCNVDVIDLSTDLTLFDMGNFGAWMTLNASDPSSPEYLEDAIISYNGFTAAAYFNGSVYAGEYGGAFYRLDAETMQGTQIGSSNSTLFGMAFNYADGYMYGVEQAGSFWEVYYYIDRVNLNTGALEQVAQFPADYTPLISIATDYEGNFYSICGDNWTYDIVLLKWNLTEDGMNVLGAWSLGEAGYGIQNNSSMVYSAEDNGLFYSDSAGVLYWIDMDSLTEENYTARVVSVGYIGEPTGYAMNMGMFTVPAEEPELPDVEIESITVPGSYMLMAGGSVSAGVVAEPWNAYPAITYAIADESIATVAADGTITGVSVGTTTLTVTIDGWDEVYEIPVTVAESAGTLYGFLISDFTYGGDFFISFTDTDPVNEIAGISDYTEFTVFSGAYFDGVLYAYGQDSYDTYKNYFLTIDPETFEITKGEKIHYTLRDMAMDYTTDNLYAIAQGGEYSGAVAQVDRETGAVTIIADTGIPFSAMTIDANGQMYGIGEDDNLYAIDKTTGELTLIGSTGVNAGALFQSMHYDLNTGNVYWAQVADDQTSSLRLVDLSSGATTSLGTISPSGAEVSALYTIPGNEPTVPDEDTFQVTGIKLPANDTVVAGETLQLKATLLTSVELLPADGAASTNAASAADVAITWTSSDETVATVDETGLVTGVKAGEVVITASAEGHSATCTVVVTEGERLLYAYDETNTRWISFSASEPGTVTTVRDDAEDETKLIASTYTGEVIYAYDENGNFYTIDPDTFERSEAMAGITEMTYSTETTDWWGDTYTVDCTLSITALSYDNGTLYAAVCAENEDAWFETTLFCTVDVTTGEMTVLFDSPEVKPTNLLVVDGTAWFVDGFMSGLLTYADLTADEFSFTQSALVQGYWGNAEASVGLFKDPLTGTVYALRDYTETDGEYDEDWNYIPWDGVTGDATLCTLNLADADIVEFGTIGEGLLLNGLFIK